MINKKNLWFVTLVSLILVLTIYYVTMPGSSLNEIDSDQEETTTVIKESSLLVALRVEEDERVLERMDALQTILLSETATVDEKNAAYDELLTINSNKGLEEKISKKIKETYSYESFIKISGEQINVVIAHNKHNSEIANSIIRLIQEEFDTKKFITVKFQ